MHRLLIISGAGLSLILVSLVFYFYISNNNVDDGAIQKVKLEQALTQAEKKLNKEKANLDKLTQDLKNSYPLAVSVQDQMKKSTDIVKQTDFMFTNPYSLNPKLIIKDYKNSTDINKQRHDINILLIEWQKKLDLLSVEKIDSSESQKIKEDIQKIQAYIKDLSEAVKILTPENSGLTQFQIATYSSQFPSIAATNDVITSIETSIQKFSSTNTSTNSQIGSTIDSSSPSGINPNVQPQTGTGEPFIHLITAEEVAAQQAVVAAAQNQVDTIRQQINQLDTQSSQTPATQTTATTPPVVTPPVLPPPINNNYSGTGIERIKYQGILVQPGPPRLVPGTDAY